MILKLLSYVGIVFGFVFLTLAIAAGLYYISELVEEHSTPTKRFLKRSIYVILGIYVLLWVFDGFPFLLTAFSMATYYVYLQNLTKFPYINLTGPVFISSCVLVVINHILWFRHFNSLTVAPPQMRMDSGFTPNKVPSFAEVASFFGICVWFIPFALFVSLSASDNLLPTMTNELNENGQGYDSDNKGKRTQGLAKVVVGRLREQLYAFTRAFGYELDPNHGRII